MDKDRDGSIEINNREVIVKNPEGLGRYPRIEPGKHVKVFVNKKEIDGETVVSEKSNIRLLKEKNEPELDLSLRINEDKMKAYLKVALKPALNIKIKDSKAANKVIVEYKIINKEYPDLNVDRLVKYISNNKIFYGINYDTIKELSETRSENELLIAEGKPCKKGKDAKINIVHKNKDEKSFNYIDSFSSGEVIAWKEEAIKGKTGYNVYGEKINPPEVIDYQLEAGKDVEIIEEGQKVIALKSGMPKIQTKDKKKIVSIIRSYVLDGGINNKTGNINYEGDLIVNGNINDYYNVKIGNDLRVNGNIANAEVMVAGDILVKNNIISSKVSAGFHFSNEIAEKLKYLHRQLLGLLQAVDEILNAADDRRFSFEKNYQIGRILKLLLTDKFKDIIPSIKNLFNDISKQKVYCRSESPEACLDLLGKLIGYKKILQLNDTFLFEELTERVGNILDKIVNNKGRSVIVADYIQNSTINAAGNIIIKNKGCYNSNLKSGEKLIIMGKKGFIRGGNYSAKEIYVRNLESGYGTVYLNIEKRLYIGSIKGNVIIKAPDDLRKISNIKKNIYYKINEDGKIICKSTKPDFKRIFSQLKYKEYLEGMSQYYE